MEDNIQLLEMGQPLSEQQQAPQLLLLASEIIFDRALPLISDELLLELKPELYLVELLEQLAPLANNILAPLLSEHQKFLYLAASKQHLF